MYMKKIITDKSKIQDIKELANKIQYKVLK